LFSIANICEYRGVIAISLQSGSNGNCIYVETSGVRLLFDAGISSIRARQRLEAFDRDIREVDALIISHDHADHVRHAGVYQRKYGLPVYITPRTLERAVKKQNLGRLKDVRYFMSGEEICFGDVTVKTIPCPHDGVDGSIFVVLSGGKRLGIWTDLGHVFEELYSVVPSLDAVFIESNYDPCMLVNGMYPSFLKQRIQGPQGHISNMEAAELLLAGSRLRWACLAHISNNNNTPQTALKTHRDIVGEDLTLYTASRYTPTGILTVP
jgi:phosphoribosyl 1,2-cyclic phosphodiesterase